MAGSQLIYRCASFVALSATIFLFVQEPARSTDPPAAGCARVTDAAQLECLINQARRRRGLRPLRQLAVLDRAARLQAGAIARCQDFSHTPCGRPFGSAFRAAGYSERHWIGENIAWGTGRLATPVSTRNRWLASPPHRRTMLSRAYSAVGVARVTTTMGGQPGVSVWVADFGGH